MRRRAIEETTGKKAGIKWVNDIFIDGKKVCGILTEASFSLESGGFDYAILGIGINVYSPAGGFPPEIAGVAGAILDEAETRDSKTVSAHRLSTDFTVFTRILQTALSFRNTAAAVQ